MKRKTTFAIAPMAAGAGIASFCFVLWLDGEPAHRVSVARTEAAQAAPAPLPSVSVPQVSRQQATYLIRSAVKTLSDANRSGNYTVLRDLASSEFQSKNTTGGLAQSFAPLRKLPLDLAMLSLIEPSLTAEPSIGSEGQLKLTGVFETTPVQVQFAFEFRRANTFWKLADISLATQSPRSKSQ